MEKAKRPKSKLAFTENGTISLDSIRSSLDNFFPNAILFDTKFTVIGLGEHIENVMGYSLAELQTQSVNVLSKNIDLIHFLQEKMLDGCFEKEGMVIGTKNGDQVFCTLSGFHLGIISNFNDIIVVQFGCMEDIGILKRQLNTKTVELEHFIQLAAHRLRGPLATIKGLVHLAQMNQSNGDMDFLISNMDRHADLLDDELYKLIYFAEEDKIAEYAQGPKLLSEILEEFQLFVDQEKIAWKHEKIEKHYAYNNFIIEKSGLVLELLKNISVFFAEMSPNNALSLRLEIIKNKDEIEISFQASGITTDFFSKFDFTKIGFTETWDNLRFLRCYNANKIIGALKGSIIFSNILTNEASAKVTVPNY